MELLKIVHGPLDTVVNGQWQGDIRALRKTWVRMSRFSRIGFEGLKCLHQDVPPKLFFFLCGKVGIAHHVDYAMSLNNSVGTYHLGHRDH